MTAHADPHVNRRKIRCAIYTRKSTEDGLEQDFNSLDAQREACEAYITSQKAEGWVVAADRFDDGGLSGGTLERPALTRLLAAIEARQIDQVVVYKIDRLTRSLSDFSKIVDRLDAVDATFVSVTQAFNTATSMGRLTLNMLLSFAQFEREVTAERIRDKIAASKKKGLWMGGSVPLGYLADGRTLKLDPETVPTVERLYALYRDHRSINEVTIAAKVEGLRTRMIKDEAGRSHRGGNPLSRGHIYQILTNPIYAGRIRHHKTVYDGLQPALIPPDDWDALQAMLQKDGARSRGVGNAGAAAPLLGKIIDDTGETLTPTHTLKSGKRIRYYISRCLVSGKAKDHPNAWRLPAVALEDRIATLVQERLADPMFIARLLPDASAADIQDTTTRANLMGLKLRRQAPDQTLALVARLHLQRDGLTVTLDDKSMAALLETDAKDIYTDALSWTSQLTLKRRGVETKLIIGTETADIDQTLLRNIHRAREWYKMMIRGMTYAEIAEETGIGKDHIKKMIDLAFLAPDLLAEMTSGTQPARLSSEWFKSNKLPTAWSAQSDLFTDL